MKPHLLTASIALNGNLSGAVDTDNGQPIGIAMPAAWDAANLTFQVSHDGGTTFNNLYDKDGTEYTVTASTSRYIILPPADFAGITHFKIRSGTAATPVTQTAARSIPVLVRPY